MQDASRYVPSLTGIRALAVVLVLGMHTEQNLPAGLEALLPFFARGYLGVDFFFLLSGFIITHVYLANLAHPNRRAVQIFFWHRFVRLYPVHVTVLAALVVVVLLAGTLGSALNNPQEWAWNKLFSQLTLLHAWGVTDSPGWNAPSWSISAEWFAYLLFPLLAPALIRVRVQAIALLIAAAVLAVTALVFTTAGWSLNTWVGMPTLLRVFGEFLCGAMLCRAAALGRLPHPDFLGTAAFVAFLIGACAGLPDLALVALLALTILGAARSKTYLANFLGSRPAVWLGEVSYSIYMVHFPVLIIIRRFWERLGFAEWPIAGRACAFLLTVALVMMLAALLFYLVERPVRFRLRDRVGRFTPA